MRPHWAVAGTEGGHAQLGSVSLGRAARSSVLLSEGAREGPTVAPAHSTGATGLGGTPLFWGASPPAPLCFSLPPL